MRRPYPTSLQMKWRAGVCYQPSKLVMLGRFPAASTLVHPK